jgi:hypothetical protein
MPRRAWKKMNEADGLKELDTAKKAGFRIEEMTPYQFRINGRLDIYPIRRRYHDVKRDARGTYNATVTEFLKEFFEDYK